MGKTVKTLSNSHPKRKRRGKILSPRKDEIEAKDIDVGKYVDGFDEMWITSPKGNRSDEISIETHTDENENNAIPPVDKEEQFKAVEKDMEKLFAETEDDFEDSRNEVYLQDGIERTSERDDFNEVFLFSNPLEVPDEDEEHETNLTFDLKSLEICDTTLDEGNPLTVNEPFNVKRIEKTESQTKNKSDTSSLSCKFICQLCGLGFCKAAK